MKVINRNVTELYNNYTFSRNSCAFDNSGNLVIPNQPRFENGAFGKGILIEAGTTNILLNPSFEGTYANGIASNWEAYYSGTATGTRNESTDSLFGTKAQRLTRTGGATSDRWGLIQSTTAVNATTASVSVYVKVLSYSAGAKIKLYCDFTNGPYGVEQTCIIADTDIGKWIRLQTTATVDTTDTCNFYVWIEGENADILIDGAQLEAKAYATSFIDDTRATENLRIPTTNILNPNEGTIEFKLKPSIITNYNNYFKMSTSNGRFLLFFSNDGRAIFDYGALNSGIATPVNTVTAGQMHTIALRWSATTNKQALFVNGIKYEQNLPNGVATSFPDIVYIVNNYSALIDDLRISNIARSDEEILADYNSELPLSVDGSTTYKENFDNASFHGYIQILKL